MMQRIIAESDHTRTRRRLARQEGSHSASSSVGGRGSGLLVSLGLSLFRCSHTDGDVVSLRFEIAC